MVLENHKEVIGFINSGACHRVELSVEEFKELIGHDAEGKHLVIMSVVVDPDYQGRRLSARLLYEFISWMRAMGKEDFHLICQRSYRHV